MKNIIILLLSLGVSIAAVAQPSLTINTNATIVETSTKYTVYPTNDLYFIYNSTTGTFQAKEVISSNLVYSANVSTVVVDTFSGANSKLDALEQSTHFRAEVANLDYLFPVGRVSIRQRYPYVEIWPAGGVAKTPIFSGRSDNISVDTEDYANKVGATSFLYTQALDEVGIIAGDSLGSGGTVNISGSMLAGYISIESGTGSKTTGPLAKIVLPRSFSNGGFFVFLQETNAPAAIYRSRLYVDIGSDRTATIKASGTALPNGTTLNFNYIIVASNFSNM